VKTNLDLVGGVYQAESRLNQSLDNERGACATGGIYRPGNTPTLEKQLFREQYQAMRWLTSAIMEYEAAMTRTRLVGTGARKDIVGSPLSPTE
jgi:hypothetical protein